MDNFNIKFILILLCMACACISVYSINFNVMDFGAVGDGRTDDSKAFSKAWQAVCTSSQGIPTLIIPKGRTFLVGPPIQFIGSCVSSNINVQIRGNIVAPDSPNAWRGLSVDEWIAFKSVNGLTISGGGIINGRGAAWWNRSCKRSSDNGCTTLGPKMVSILSCNNVNLNNIMFVDSQSFHIHMWNCMNATITGIRLRAPDESPNTDGIHVAGSHNVRIDNVDIGTGDDCISIGDQTSDVSISRVVCGPGHGISIGSLGRHGDEANVENIQVSDVKFIQTTNGARIKTWQGGNGYARNITFQNIQFKAVENPVIIDQYYCDASHCTKQVDAVKISNVKFMHLSGTSIDESAISLMCSQTVSCTGILMKNVTILPEKTGDKAGVSCVNAHGRCEGNVLPEVPCLN